MSDVHAALVWCPFPDTQSARDIAALLLEEKLIACANILPAMEAVFEWDGKVSTAQEVAVMFKTQSALLDALIKRLGDCHPYDTPAIVGWHCDASHPATAGWLGELLGTA